MKPRENAEQCENAPGRYIGATFGFNPSIVAKQFASYPLAEQKEANSKAGRAFMGVITGSLMIGTVTFLNAMLKNKGKKYRDDDDELSAEEILKNLAKQFVSDSAGLVIGGDTLEKMLGAILAGDKWYEVDAPGIEQLNEILKGIVDAGKTMTKLVKDSLETAKTEASWTQYSNQRKPAREMEKVLRRV